MAASEGRGPGDVRGDRSYTTVIADDDPHYRHFLHGLLEAEGFRVLAAAADAPGAVAATVEQQPELCVLDIDMPGGGIEAAQEIHRVASDVVVVTLTAMEEPDLPQAATQAGAHASLTKAASPREIVEDLHAVLEGGTVRPSKKSSSTHSRPLGGPAQGEERHT